MLQNCNMCLSKNFKCDCTKHYNLSKLLQASVKVLVGICESCPMYLSKLSKNEPIEPPCLSVSPWQKQEPIVLERSARLILDLGRGD